MELHLRQTSSNRGMPTLEKEERSPVAFKEHKPGIRNNGGGTGVTGVTALGRSSPLGGEVRIDSMASRRRAA